ncbi:hypothetical protein D3C78_1364380 [compost metagenome]
MAWLNGSSRYRPLRYSGMGDGASLKPRSNSASTSGAQSFSAKITRPLSNGSIWFSSIRVCCQNPGRPNCPITLASP